MKRIITAVVAVVVMAGCSGMKKSTIGEGDNKITVRAEVEGIDDVMESNVVVSSGYFERDKDGSHYFRGFISKSDPRIMTYQIYGETIYYYWMNWRGVKFSVPNGSIVEIPAKVIASKVGCYRGYCPHSETYIADISRDLLSQWSKNETRIRLVSANRENDDDIDIQPEIVADFLDAMDKVSKHMKK